MAKTLLPVAFCILRDKLAKVGIAETLEVVMGVVLRTDEVIFVRLQIEF